MKKHLVISLFVILISVTCLYCCSILKVMSVFDRPERPFYLGGTSLAIYKDNKTFIFNATVYGKLRAFIHNPDTGEYKVITKDHNSRNHTFSKNGDKIYYFSYDDNIEETYLRVSDANGENERILYDKPDVYCTNLVVSPDGNNLYYNKAIVSLNGAISKCRSHTKLYRYNIKSNEEIKLSEDTFFSLDELQISNDWNYLFFSTKNISEFDYSIKRFEMLTGEYIEFLPTTGKDLVNKEHLVVVPNVNYFYVFSDKNNNKVNEKGEYLEKVYSFKFSDRKSCYSISSNGKRIMYSYFNLWKIERINKCETLINDYYHENTCYGLFDLNKMQEEFVKVDAYKILELFKDENPVVQ